jgi:hypothetical protein
MVASSCQSVPCLPFISNRYAAGSRHAILAKDLLEVPGYKALLADKKIL